MSSTLRRSGHCLKKKPLYVARARGGGRNGRDRLEKKRRVGSKADVANTSRTALAGPSEGGEVLPSVDLIASKLEENSDSKKAGEMAKYMRNQFKFFGVQAPVRRRICKEIMGSGKKFLPRLAPTSQVVTTAKALWEQEHRECQHTACDILLGHDPQSETETLTLLDCVEDLVQEKSWWDTVDCLSSVVGRHFHSQGVRERMDQWINAENMWLRRVAIICQNTRGRDTDSKRLYDYCKQHAHDKEVRIRVRFRICSYRPCTYAAMQCSHGYVEGVRETRVHVYPA
ncbi:hypothetical protein AAMO2058_001288700 [Amorphochlora amoebiformis]